MRKERVASALANMFAVLIAVLSLAALPQVARAAGLSVGDAAPDFVLSATDGTTVTLRDLVGKQAVVVAWFPKAFTPG
jgi:peroxiredoxin Q/BCP